MPTPSNCRNFDTLKQLGASESNTFIFPMEFTNLLRAFRTMVPKHGWRLGTIERSTMSTKRLGLIETTPWFRWLSFVDTYRTTCIDPAADLRRHFGELPDRGPAA